MKVVINRAGYFKDCKLNKLIEGKSEFEWRTDTQIVAIVEKRLSEIAYLKELVTSGKASDELKKRLEVRTSLYSDWTYFRVVEVDTSRKWTIAEYDTAYFVQYLSECNEHNYVELLSS